MGFRGRKTAERTPFYAWFVSTNILCGFEREAIHQQDDICSGQVFHMYLRFDGQPFTDVARVAVLECKLDDGGNLDRDAIV